METNPYNLLPKVLVWDNDVRLSGLYKRFFDLEGWIAELAESAEQFWQKKKQLEPHIAIVHHHHLESLIWYGRKELKTHLPMKLVVLVDSEGDEHHTVWSEISTYKPVFKSNSRPRDVVFSAIEVLQLK